MKRVSPASEALHFVQSMSEPYDGGVSNIARSFSTFAASEFLKDVRALEKK